MAKDAYYILTVSCPDKRGIVAAVTGFLQAVDGFILESTQFGDASTGRFFMRVSFAAGKKTPKPETFRAQFAKKVGDKFAMEWELHDATRRPRVLILVSKQRHCLNDLMYRWQTGQLPIDIPAVISNHEDARGMVEWHGIPYQCVPNALGKAKQEKAISDLIAREKIDLVVLARYMQILSPALCRKLAGRAINIHHSFLPSFKGAKPYHQAFDRGVKLIGATAHYVTPDLDEGPIIEQEVTRVDHSFSADSLAQVGHDVEAQVLARAVRYQVEHRILRNGHKTVVFR